MSEIVAIYPLHKISAEDLENLHQSVQSYAILKGDFILASGLTSKYYYDGKKILLNPRWAWAVGRAFLRPVLDSGAEAVGGRATGAIPVAVVISLAAYLISGKELPVFYVRERPKGHGTRDSFSSAVFQDGKPLLCPGRKVAIVDDVVTTGGSAQEAVEAVEDLGCKVVFVGAVVERHERGGRTFSERGYPFFRLFYTDEDGQLHVAPEALAGLQDT